MFNRFLHKIQSVGNFLQTPFLFLVRLYWGYQFAHAGYSKLIDLPSAAHFFQSIGLPLPYVHAPLVGGIELVGGLLLLIGLFSRLVSVPLIIIMIVAYLTTEQPALSALWTKYSPTLFFNATPFLFIYAAILILCFGPGKLSLDYLVNKEM